MNRKVYSEDFERETGEYIRKILPDKIFDAHSHIEQSYADGVGYSGPAYNRYKEFCQKYLGDRVKKELLMAQPYSRFTPDDIIRENEYIIDIAAKNNQRVGILVHPAFGKKKVEDYLDKYSVITALKPYLSYSTAPDDFDSDILDFAPEWLWEIANQRGLPVIIHLSHYKKALNDIRNIKQIRYLSEKYPNSKIVLAHCALGHNVPNLKMGIEKIRDLKNIWFDFSGVSETMSIYYCIKYFGIDKMMFGVDYYFGGSLGRICSVGSGFIGLHKRIVDESQVPEDYSYEPLNILQESLIAFCQVAELMNLGKEDIEKVFYKNAEAIY